MDIRKILEKNEWWYSDKHWEKIAITCHSILDKAGTSTVIINSVEWGEACGIDSRPLIRGMKKWIKKKGIVGITNSVLHPIIFRIAIGKTTKHGTRITITRL